MKRTVQLIVVILVVLAVGAIGLTGWDTLSTSQSRLRSRERVQVFFKKIHDGMTKSDCLREANLLWPKEQIREYSNSGEDYAVLRSSPEFGAKNWVVSLAFRDNLLKQATVRTSDSSAEKPAGSPDDISTNSP